MTGSDTTRQADAHQGPIPVGISLDNKYVVQRILGRGSMGIVYLAKDLALERNVAIKVLLPLYAADANVAKRFRREAVAMASVRHDNVVQIFAFGDFQGNPYFVMEYIPGQTVSTLVEHARQRDEFLYLDVVIGILNQVCHGLQAVHDRRIVHRDVKPANMLIGPQFKVTITDFGLVEKVGDHPLQRDLAGTPLYLAPELIRRETLQEHQFYLCDIYALGISAFEMLTNEVPFDGVNVKEILQRHLTEPPPLISSIRNDIPTAFDEVLGRAMNKTPTLRYASCLEFFDAVVEARERESFAPRSATKRILIVDDDPDIRSIYSTALRVGLPNAVVIAAEDGLQAMEMIKASSPDLILLDLEMPRMNGLEVCASLTGDELTATIPLVVLTSHKEEKVRSLLKNMGVRHVLSKPVELTHLIDLAQRYLQRPGHSLD